MKGGPEVAYNVLIADDSKTTRRIIAKALRHAGVQLGEVREAADGLEALAELESSWVDIVFADLNMPRMSGIELVERMAETDLLSSIPVVVVSTEGRQQRIDSLLAQGVASYVRKPFTPEELAEAVHSLLTPADTPATPDMLEDSFFNAIEGFGMLVAEPLVMQPDAPEHASIARMRLIGSRVVADIALAVPVEGGRTIAMTATGEDDASGGADALMELLNVTAGHLVDVLAGGPFMMGPPHAEQLPGSSAWAQIAGMSLKLPFDVEGMPLLIGLDVADRW